MRYLRVYNVEGTTRVAEEDLALVPAVFAPPAPPLDVSASQPVQELTFIHFEAGWSDPSHPAPARQWMLVLAGRGVLTAGAETWTWGPGDVILLEDTEAPGHGTHILEDATLAAVRC